MTLFRWNTGAGLTCGVQMGRALEMWVKQVSSIFHDFVGGKTSCTPARLCGTLHAILRRWLDISHGKKTLNPPIGSWKTKTSMISVNQSVLFMIHATFALHRLVPVALCQANRTDFRFPQCGFAKAEKHRHGNMLKARAVQGRRPTWRSERH